MKKLRTMKASGTSQMTAAIMAARLTKNRLWARDTISVTVLVK